MSGTEQWMTIDSAEGRGSQEYVELIWSGWSVFPQLNGLEIQLFVNGQRSQTPEITYHARPDVTKLFPQYKEEALHGFKIIWRQEWEQFSLDDCVELLAVQGNETKTVWPSKSAGLRKLLEGQAISYCLDEKRLDDEKLYIQGWCVSKMGGAPEMTLCNSNGQKCEAEWKVIARPDVSNAFIGDDSQKDCGFLVTFPYNVSETYILSFRNALQNLEITLSPKQIKKMMIKEEKRRFLPLPQIIKSLDKKQVSEDGKLLIRQGTGALRREWLRRYGKPSYLYERWFDKNKASVKELGEQREKRFAFMPKISIVVPAYQTPELFLKQMVASVEAQTYSNWELCIADGGVDDTIVETIMKEYCAKDERILYRKLGSNLGISGNTNAALDMATGEFVALLDHDDILPPEALYEMVKAINEEKADVLYSDEDKISMDLKHHFDPHFKPDFNLDMLRSDNYICHFFVVRRDLIEELGGFRSDFDGSQDYDLILRCTEKAKRVCHIPKILYHWRMHQNSTAANPESKLYCFEAGIHVIEDHLKRENIIGSVQMTEHYGHYRVTYPVKNKNLISVFLLLTGSDEQKEITLASLERYASEIQYEVILIACDKQTSKVSPAELNRQLTLSKGNLILILEAGMELQSKEKLDEWIGECERDDVAIVGARIFDSNNQLVSCGQIFSKSGQIKQLFVGYLKYDPAYFARTKVQQNLSLLSLNGVMIKKDLFQELGGWNTAYGKTLADADLCLRIGRTGKKIVLDPGIELLQSTKPIANDFINQSEREKFVSEWKTVLEAGDPAYNPNLDDDSGNFKIRIQ